MRGFSVATRRQRSELARLIHDLANEASHVEAEIELANARTAYANQIADAYNERVDTQATLH
jgi:hypothetical protein